MQALTVRAEQLQVGDLCRGSRQLVVAINPVRPGDKYVHLVTQTRPTKRDPRGRLAGRAWNRRTTIEINRPDLTAEQSHPHLFPSDDPAIMPDMKGNA